MEEGEVSQSPSLANDHHTFSISSDLALHRELHQEEARVIATLVRGLIGLSYPQFPQNKEISTLVDQVAHAHAAAPDQLPNVARQLFLALSARSHLGPLRAGAPPQPPPPLPPADPRPPAYRGDDAVSYQGPQEGPFSVNMSPRVDHYFASESDNSGDSEGFESLKESVEHTGSDYDDSMDTRSLLVRLLIP